MNLLIVGGLFILGVLALVGLVFVIRSEPAPKESTDVPSPPPTTQAEPVMTPTLASENTTPVAEEVDVHKWSPVSGYELANELHALRKQAQELEQRLSILIDAVERVDQNQKGNFPIEDHKPSSDAQKVN